MSNSELDIRMKRYEQPTRFILPRRTNTIVRIDGKAFHTFTRGLNKPFDYQLIETMKQTTMALCEEIDGAKLGYQQSDEISIWMTDYDSIHTEPWFGGVIQKICSVSASIATATFAKYSPFNKRACFDSRVFTIPDPIEVENYFISRQKDGMRNSVQMVSSCNFSPKELYKKSVNEQQEMLFQKRINWNDFPFQCKRGIVVIKTNNGWESVETPIFTQDRDFIRNLFPNKEG